MSKVLEQLTDDDYNPLPEEELDDNSRCSSDSNNTNDA